MANTARQLGTVLGTVILTVVLQSGVTLTTIRHGWELIAAAAVMSAVIATALAFAWRTSA